MNSAQPKTEVEAQILIAQKLEQLTIMLATISKTLSTMESRLQYLGGKNH